MIQEDINSYNSKDFKLKFESTSLYKKIYDDHDLISYDDNLNIFDLKQQILSNYPVISINNTKIYLTPRRCLSFSIFDAVSLYYLEYLTDLNPSKIYDVGCGSNSFKKYIPNIVGIDVPDSKNKLIKNTADYYDNSLIDNSFYVNNFEKFNSAFSICSLHYFSLQNIRERVIQFSSLISKGGRGYIALNISIMLESYSGVEKFLKPSQTQINEIDKFVRKKLYNLPFKIEVFESTIKKEYDNYLNGNVRIVFTK